MDSSADVDSSFELFRSDILVPGFSMWCPVSWLDGTQARQQVLYEYEVLR